MTMTSEQREVSFNGHCVAYRVAGEGPALVVLRQNRAKLDSIQLRALRDSYQVFQIDPLGYAASDRPAGYPAETLPDQVLSVLDHHGVDRFVCWGYSKSGAMSAAIARATPRAAGMVAGAFGLLNRPSEAMMRRGYREAFYRWFFSFDWTHELAVMACPKLVYFGGDDLGEQGRSLRRTREQLEGTGVDVVEFEGLDHRTIGDDDPMTTRIIPWVDDWVRRRVGMCW
ncbi:MAG: alpha/beta hydrolase [Actinobacteria bacterium]|nr:alpha/beta hydrolase [Actinomycetota bacterium]